MAIFNASQLLAISQFEDNALNSLGKLHRVFYTPTMVDCSNCLVPANSTYLGNAGLHGGPMPNLCGFCGGTGKIAVENSDTVLLEVDWSSQRTQKTNSTDAPGVRLPYDVLLVKGYLTDLPKLQQCIEIQLDLPSFPVTFGRYKLSGDGIDAFNVIQGRFFLGVLTRVS